MGRLTVFLSDLKFKRFGDLEIAREVYLLTIGMDLSQSATFAGNGDTMSTLVPDTFREFNKYAVVGLSPVFERVRPGDSLNILGDGINLYGPKDPKGKIMLHTAVMESDRRNRDFGKTLKTAIENAQLFDFVQGVADIAGLADPKIQLLTNAVRYAFETAVYLLKQDRDDVISTFHYSSIDRDGRGYSISPNGFWEIDDRFIQGHYRVTYERNTESVGHPIRLQQNENID